MRSIARAFLWSVAVVSCVGCATPKKYVPIWDSGSDPLVETDTADAVVMDRPQSFDGVRLDGVGGADDLIGGMGSAGTGGSVGGAVGPDAGVGGGGAPGTDGATMGTGGTSSAIGGTVTGAGGSRAETGGTSAGTGKAGIGGGGMGGVPGIGAGGAAGGTGGSPVCPSTQHLCLGACVDSSAVAHCGTRCAPCPMPIGGTSTCDGNVCDFTCGSMKKCGSKCVSGCCVDGDCPIQAAKTGKCDSATNTCSYVCAAGFKPCGAGLCIPAGNCCSESDCAGTCRTCSLSGTCVTVANMSDPDSCPGGFCDGSGVCCPSNMSVCGGACTDTSNSNAHCGHCGAPCLAVQMCRAGACLLRDGQPCALAADCASGICNAFYRDEDGDGHGAPTGAMRLCTVTTPPAGYVAAGDDCCDNGGNLLLAAKIHPGTDYQPTSAGGICGINWDWNCSGQIDLGPDFDVSTECDRVACGTFPRRNLSNASEFCGQGYFICGCTPLQPPAGTCTCYQNGPAPTDPGYRVFTCR